MGPMPLTNASIDRARREAATDGRRIEAWDDAGKVAVRPLHARISPSGVVTFYVRYRVGKAQRRDKLGVYGDALTIDQARELARDRLAAVARGEDPSRARARAREVPTVAQGVAEYLTAITVAPRTLATYRQRLEAHVVPTLGKRLVTDVTAADVRRVHKRLTAKGSAVQANRVVEGMRAFYTWAMVEWPEAVTSNPARFSKAAGLRKNAEDLRTRTITPDERQAILDALEAAERKPRKTTGHVSPTYAAAFRLALLTGMRPIDIVTLRHENITRAVAQGRKVWVAVWPARGEGRTKKANQRRVLNSAAIDIIEGQAKRQGNPAEGWVFPNAAGTQTSSNQLSRTFREVRIAAKLPGDVTLYVAGRHTYISEGVMSGIPLAVMGADVDNASAVARYAHLQRAVDGGVSEAVLARLQGGKGSR